MVLTDEGLAGRPASNHRIAVLEWRAWKGFLLAHVLGDDAERIETDPFSEFPSGEFDRIADSFNTVCFQINLSVRSRLPLGIRELTKRFVDRGIHVVNGVVQDIRKSILHAHLDAIGLASLKALPAGPSGEILFVKTDLNYGGDLERWLPPEHIVAVGFEDLISSHMGAYRYSTVKRELAPEDIWTDPAIVVERYVSNSEDSFYRVYFSGEQVIIVKAFALGIIKKLANDARDTNFVSDLEHLKTGTDNLPISRALKADVARFVENTPVDFGCIDIVHDGRDHHYIVDLNLTPYAGTRVYDHDLNQFLLTGITNPSQRKVLRFLDSPLAGG